MRFQPSGRCVVVAAGSTLLAAARRVGLPLAAACGGDALCGALRCDAALGRRRRLARGRGGGEGEAPEPRRSQGSASRAAPRLLGDLEVTASYW